MRRRADYPWDLKTLLSGKPTVGWLMDLCEENYRYLMRLAPDMRTLQGGYRSRLEQKVDLYLEVLEQTPYTSLLHLTYYFSHGSRQYPDPDAIIRIYHDSRQAEVLSLKQQLVSLSHRGIYPTLEQKWKISLFLSKWLSYSVREGHCFLPEHTTTAPAQENLLPV